MPEPQTLYVASSNPGKLRDFAFAAEAFAQGNGSRFRLLPLPGLATTPAPAEDADTFEGNARTKAVYYSLHAPPGSLVLADDSGLEVDLLGGAPGVYSARYAVRAEATPGAGSLDEANNRHLLSELARVRPTAEPWGDHPQQRTCRYHCVLAAARCGAILGAAHGRVDGQILLKPRGDGGFGYDPLFYLPTLDRTMAELDSLTRLGLSHRGEALRTLLPTLAAVLGPPLAL